MIAAVKVVHLAGNGLPAGHSRSIFLEVAKLAVIRYPAGAQHAGCIKGIPMVADGLEPGEQFAVDIAVAASAVRQGCPCIGAQGTVFIETVQGLIDGLHAGDSCAGLCLVKVVSGTVHGAPA